MGKPKESALIKRRRIAASKGLTLNPYDFTHICKKHPSRVSIVAEGDSWFAYPKKWIAAGADMNIIHHICSRVAYTNTVNMLRLASNGDEAVEMTSGRQFRKLSKIIEKNSACVDLVLFSGGGNDIVGKYDLLPLLNDYSTGMSVKDCIKADRFERKLDAIELAYIRLLELCADKIPDAKVITHTYDIAKPWNQGAVFFWGLYKTKPWVYPNFTLKGIPRDMHLPLIKTMLEAFRDRMVALAAQPEYSSRFIVVDTQGILRPGSKKDWQNEIHPSKAGFEKIAKRIYRELKYQQPTLPKW